MPSTLSITPAGVTVALSVANSNVSTTVASLTPVRSYYVTNTGNSPVQLRLDPTGSTTAVFPSPGSPQLGTILGSQDDLVINIPTVLATGTNQFSSLMNVSAISNTTTANLVYITPIQA
jgi:hypothetical protein